MTAFIVFLGDHALAFAWAFIAFGVAFHLLVAWINRPLWFRRWCDSVASRLRGFFRRFRGAL